MQSLTIAAAGAVFLAGCASLSPDAGFGDVQNLLARRIDQRAQWNRDSNDDRATAQAVERLLAQPLGAEDAVQVALLNNRKLQALYGDLGIAQADLVQAGLLHNPVFSAQRWAAGNSFKSEIAIEFNFLSLLFLPMRRQAEAAKFEQTKLSVADEVVKLAAEVRAQYYRTLAAGQSAAMQQDIAASSEAAAELATRQLRAGNLSLKKQSQFQVEHAQTLKQSGWLRRTFVRERERLGRLMGLSGAQMGWKLPELLPEVPSARPRFDNLEALAVEQRLDVQGSKQQLEYLAKVSGVTNAARWIESLTLGYGVLNESDTPRRRGPLIAFELPIFDQGQARVGRMDAMLRQGEQRLVDAASNARSEAREKYSDLLGAYDQVEYQRDAILPLRAKILAQTQLLYNGMLEGVYDLLGGYRSHANAGQALIDAARDYWIAYSELERAVGGRLPRPSAGPPAVGDAAGEPPAQPASPARMNAPAPRSEHRH